MQAFPDELKRTTDFLAATENKAVVAKIKLDCSIATIN